jgi:preprotein translocase subunit SecG
VDRAWLGGEIGAGANTDTGLARTSAILTTLFCFLDGITLVLLRRVERHLFGGIMYV